MIFERAASWRFVFDMCFPRQCRHLPTHKFWRSWTFLCFLEDRYGKPLIASGCLIWNLFQNKKVPFHMIPHDLIYASIDFAWIHVESITFKYVCTRIWSVSEIGVPKHHDCGVSPSSQEPHSGFFEHASSVVEWFDTFLYSLHTVKSRVLTHPV